MLLLPLLLGCAPGSSKPPPDGADSPGVDTSESGDSPAESDSPESADTTDTTETAETGDSVPWTDWAPGEEVPGWSDADCTEPSPGRSFVFEYPDLFRFEGRFTAEVAWAGPHEGVVQLRDCNLFLCPADSLSLEVPYVWARLEAVGDDGATRGEGEWGPDEVTARHVGSSGRSALVDWENDGTAERAPASVTVCLERVRPDEVRGVVRVEVTAGDYPYIAVSYYDSVVFRFPFDVLLPERSGEDLSRPATPEDRPEGFDVAHFLYDQPYDEAWPWDDIRDPSIREQLYERYRPYNVE